MIALLDLRQNSRNVRYAVQYTRTNVRETARLPRISIHVRSDGQLVANPEHTLNLPSGALPMLTAIF